jgi:protein-S-isoprenylcysteine O-methyltransferase Ste14
MVNYEENILEEKFGKDYLEYKNKVSKWIPSIKKRL